MRVLVTGGTGFVGSAIVRRCLSERDLDVVATVRTRNDSPPVSPLFEVGDLSGQTQWDDALRDVHVVVHTAARVHVTSDMAGYDEYRRTNVEGTLGLARRAAARGVRRFIFLSSIKVNGDSTPTGRAFTASDVPAPHGSYAISKHEAEVGLREIGSESGMEVVSIRPVLVYGPGVKANFRALLRLIATGLPLPFGAVNNRRSLVSVDNLVDFVRTVVGHIGPLNGTFLVSDGDDLSLPELIRRLARGMDRPARLLPVPEGVLRAVAVAARRRDVVEKLLDSLQVDIGDNQRLLGWHPPFASATCLAETGRWFASLRQR